MNLTQHIYFEGVESKFKILKKKFANQPEAKLQRLAEIIEQRKLDLNKIKEEEIDSILNTKTKSEAKRKGLEGLVKGKDYIELNLDYNAKGYIVLNHKASRAIASMKVCSVEGKWCVAENSPEHWHSYFYGGEGLLVFIIDPEERKKSDRKRALWYGPVADDPNHKEYAMWDADDEMYSKNEINNILDNYGLDLKALYKKYRSKDVQKNISETDRMHRLFMKLEASGDEKVLQQLKIKSLEDFNTAIQLARGNTYYPNVNALKIIFDKTNLSKEDLLKSQPLKDLKESDMGKNVARVLLPFAKKNNLYTQKEYDMIQRYAK